MHSCEELVSRSRLARAAYSGKVRDAGAALSRQRLSGTQFLQDGQIGEGGELVCQGYFMAQFMKSVSLHLQMVTRSYLYATARLHQSISARRRRGVAD